MWQIAMVVLLALVSLERLSGQWPTHRIRTGLAMIGCSIAGHMSVAITGDATPLLAWIFTDAIAGFVVLARPAGLAQKAIGVTYIMLVLYHIGFAVSVSPNADLYIKFQVATGWAQLVIFALWGASSAGKHISRYLWPDSGSFAAEKVIGGKK